MIQTAAQSPASTGQQFFMSAVGALEDFFTTVWGLEFPLNIVVTVVIAIAAIAILFYAIIPIGMGILRWIGGVLLALGGHNLSAERRSVASRFRSMEEKLEEMNRRLQAENGGGTFLEAVRSQLPAAVGEDPTAIRRAIRAALLERSPAIVSAALNADPAIVERAIQMRLPELAGTALETEEARIMLDDQIREVVSEVAKDTLGDEESSVRKALVAQVSQALRHALTRLCNPDSSPACGKWWEDFVAKAASERAKVVLAATTAQSQELRRMLDEMVEKALREHLGAGISPATIGEATKGIVEASVRAHLTTISKDPSRVLALLGPEGERAIGQALRAELGLAAKALQESASTAVRAAVPGMVKSTSDRLFNPSQPDSEIAALFDTLVRAAARSTAHAGDSGVMAAASRDLTPRLGTLAAQRSEVLFTEKPAWLVDALDELVRRFLTGELGNPSSPLVSSTRGAMLQAITLAMQNRVGEIVERNPALVERGGDLMKAILASNGANSQNGRA